MYLVIRFWHTIKNQVSVRYWDFKLLGHTKVHNILAKFNDSVSLLDLNKMTNVQWTDRIQIGNFSNSLKDIDWRMNSIS